jgi:hypothetical protein
MAYSPCNILEKTQSVLACRRCTSAQGGASGLAWIDSRNLERDVDAITEHIPGVAVMKNSAGSVSLAFLNVWIARGGTVMLEWKFGVRRRRLAEGKKV